LKQPGKLCTSFDPLLNCCPLLCCCNALQPRTIIIDTWEAFDDAMTFNLGGDIASFGDHAGVCNCMSLATRLDWTLESAREAMSAAAAAAAAVQSNQQQQQQQQQPLRWILKASTLNKGDGVHLVADFEQLRAAVHAQTDIREWVSELLLFQCAVVVHCIK
jgi:hypothetical protein